MDSYWVESDSPEDISHHGVLGMKWGVRRRQKKAAKAQKQLAKAQKKFNKYNTDHTVNVSKPDPLKKAIGEMSDTELRSRINRLQMEKQYQDLLKGPVQNIQPQQKNEGQSFAKQFAKDSVKTLGAAAVSVVAEQVVKKAVSEQISKRTRFKK